MNNVILDSFQINQKIKRLSYEIYENNLKENSIILVGINQNGLILSKEIKKYLDDLFPDKTQLFHLTTNKNKLFSDNQFDFNKNHISNKIIVIIDDVLNSGKTIAYSISSILSFYPKKVEVAVLVDRSYKKFPVFSKYKGIELNTTINEHVKIDFNKKIRAYLI